MLVHVDVVDCGNAIRNLCQICLIGKMTLILAWSLEETARYIGLSPYFFSLFVINISTNLTPNRNI